MAFFAQLNGQRVIEGRIVIPAFGAPHASVTLDSAATLPAKGLSLSLAALTLVMTPWFPPTSYQARTSIKLIAGFGGWKMPLKDKGYVSTGGVRLATVLGDAAKEVGEQIQIATDRSLGQIYSRERNTPASTHLNYLLYHNWRIDPDGVTRDGQRPTSKVLSSFTIQDFDGAKRSATIATENPEDITPGRTLTNVTMGGATWTINGVTHTISQGAVRTEVLIS